MFNQTNEIKEIAKSVYFGNRNGQPYVFYERSMNMTERFSFKPSVFTACSQ